MKKNITIIILIIIVIILSISLYNVYNKPTIKNKVVEEKITKSNTTNKKEKELENIEEQETKDTEVINYVSDIEYNVENITSKENLSSSDKKTLKNYFITLTDFIFYDGTIKGVTFSELSTSVKDKVISIYEKIDSKIENKFPNYKETIKATATKTYNNIKDKTIEVKDKILEEYKNKVGEDKYRETEQAYKDGIEDAKDVYETYKPYLEEGKEKGKSALEKAKEKVKNWYESYREG